MRVKDIVYKDLINLENCEDEPIHIPGLIQPHGFLISYDSVLDTINVCSENILDFLSYTYHEILGKKINQIFDENFVNYLKDYIESRSEQKFTFNHTCNDNLLAFTLHRSKDNIIIEAEKGVVQEGTEDKLFNSSKKLLGYIEDTSSLKNLCHSVALAVKDITGYDRVMVYKFDMDYNGEVYAEVKENHLEPFLGLHYPNTDIPSQARALFLKNQLRIIGNVHYEPVKLYTYEESEVDTLDLSLSVLRSASPIHLTYLENMGVKATLTISLIHKGKLWGLIACHHHAPRYLSQEAQNAVRLQCHFITSQIDVRILNEEFEIANQANNRLDVLSSKSLEFKRKCIEELFVDDNILDLCNSDGVSAYIGGKFYTRGNTPNIEDIKYLSNLFSVNSTSGIFISSKIPRLSHIDIPVADQFPGMNFHMLDDEDYIVWYRVPTITTIKWAGDPSKAIGKKKNSLTPRKSFVAFSEKVKDTSKPWLEPEINTSNKFKMFLQSFVKAIVTNEAKERERKLNEHLKAVNAELENITWITTHDLQEPLRKIRIMASSLLENQEYYEVTALVEKRIDRMSKSAERMQNLVKNVLDYNKAGTEPDNFEIIDLNHLIVGVKEEIQDKLEDENASIEVAETLPTISGNPFLLRQCILNLFQNALKFKVQDRDVKIQVFLDDLDEKSDIYSVIAVKDNGIGFSNDQKEKIFNIFARLHNKLEYDGTGIGLALCKKIMFKHEGFIRADGIENEGATMRLYFPKS